MAAKSFNYNVQIFSTQKPYAVNSLAIEQTNDSELATVSGTQCQSVQGAQDQLMFHPNESLPNVSTASRSVWLAGTLYATEYSDTWNSVVWHEGDWLLVVRGPSGQQNVNDAKTVAETLNSEYLPPTNGVVWIRNISDGSGPASPSTQVLFVENTNMYQISAQGQIYNPIVLTSFMKS